MGVSRLQAQTNVNDFSVAIGTSGNEEIALNREYPAGSYSISSQLSDSSLDVYAVSSSGQLVGHTTTTALACSSGFTKLVITGSTNNDLINFQYKATYSPSSRGTLTVVSPFITEVDPSSAVNIDDTVTVTGGNFAEDVEVFFTGSDDVTLSAKNVVRVSSTELLVTRPDQLVVDASPYTVSATNPNVPTSQGNRHQLTNSLTAGTKPVWQTSASLAPYWVGNAVSLEALASDSENSDITYSIVSGTLPSGLSLNVDTGAITGTSSGSEAVGTTTLVTIRAADTGSNYLDRQFTFTANGAPTWVTSGSLEVTAAAIAGGLSVSATPAISGAGVTYSVIAGTLGGGLSLGSNGELTGSITGESSSIVTIRATDAYGAYADQELTLVTTRQIKLYYNGDQATAVTGGWSQLYSTGGSSSFNSNHIYLSVPSINGYDVAVATANAINLTDYSTLEIYWSTTDVPYGAHFGIISNRVSLRTQSPVASTTRDKSGGAGQTGFQRQTLDVSNYNGSYYIYVATDGAENLSWNNYIAGGNTSTYEVILK